MVQLTPSRLLVFVGLLMLFSAAVIIATSSVSFRKAEALVSSNIQPPNYQLPHSSDQGLGNNEEELFTFVQMTDLHISIFTDPNRTEQLWEFCNTTLNAVSPHLVIVSGDLTDGKSHQNSIVPVDRQFEKEWKTYDKFHQYCLNVTGIKTWLDIRGNHDNFNVDGYNSSTSYYPKYGAKRASPGSYMVKINASAHTQYAFVAVDATLDYGLSRFFNFIGVVDQPEKLAEFQSRIENDPKINATIWFGHYPTSSISTLFSTGPTLREIAAKGIVYLCGHLHREPFHLLSQIHAHHSSGMLELELSDWKTHRSYRVAALDKGLFSFVDVNHGTWPVILVTNPKPAETVQPSKEPTVLMATSSYVRLLVYSPSPIQLCEVRINEVPWMTCKLTGKSKPLYTALWNPDLYSKGKHVLEARAQDSSGALNLVKFEFSLDGTRSEFSSFFGQLVLKINFTSLSFGAFCCLVFSLVVPLWIIRCFQKQCPRHWFFRKMWVFATTDILFYPFAFYTLVWLPTLPWFIGYVTDAQIGYVFAWGTYVNGHFVLGTFSYFYGWLHMMSFNLPLIFLLANAADLRYQQLVIMNEREETFLRDWLTAVVFLMLQLFINYMFWVCFGAMATLLNPMRTWSLLLAVYLWLKVMNRAQRAWDLICWLNAKWKGVAF